MKQPALALVILLAALPAAAQDFAHGRIRHVEGGTTLQRASETGSEEAFRNLPFFPGDRIWTDETGRAEFQFGGATRVRLDERSKLDYVEHEEGRGSDRVVLRLWSGSLIVRGQEARGAPDFAIETPVGLVEARGGTVARVDVGPGETRLSVFEGDASLDNGRRNVRVEAGERTAVARGGDPERPFAFDRREGDAFARWDSDRERQRDWASVDAQYLPEEVAPYAPELERNGSWHFDVQIGHVWQPHVTAGWRPYQNGRWVWSQYGWTWVPNETWGWAPFHYGRWGQSAELGWYWIPGRTWGPAWVSWSLGGDYVGWCALGRGDRPLGAGDARVLGRAVPRGAQASPWIYTRRADLTARDLARRRVELADSDASAVRVVERNAHVDRSVRAADGERAVPRNVQIRPTPGDTIPELRADPMTTIPFPVARRRYASEDERREREGRDRSRVRYDQGAPATQSSPAPPEASDDSTRRRGEGDARTPSREAAAAGERRRGSAAERDRDGDRSPDREVLRRVFGPLSGASVRDRSDGEKARAGGRETPRDTPRDDGEKARARSREAPRDTPRVEQPQPKPPDGGGDTARRKKDPDR